MSTGILIYYNQSVFVLNNEFIHRLKQDLLKNGLQVGQTAKLKDVEIKLPQLYNKNIEDHFRIIAEEQTQPYKELLGTLLVDIPEIPSNWVFKSGWTRYDRINGPQSVDHPCEDALIFDIEVCLAAGGKHPTMATAVSYKYWYSWTSPDLIESRNATNPHSTVTNMIPIESKADDSSENFTNYLKKPKIIVGHNVSYDRARIKEQYWLEQTGLRFVDTMSLHVCVSGVTSYQRAMLKSSKEMSEDDLNWSSKSSLNSLSEVYKLYCGKELDKEKRNIFVDGTLDDIRDDFQNLMTYCANDVKATHNVFKSVYTLFLERFPHPVTLAGMLEIGTAYLPVNSNWKQYINEADLTYEDLSIESNYLLARRADQALSLMHDEKYKRDLWMWDQDWSVQELKLKKPTKKSRSEVDKDIPKSNNPREDELRAKFQYLFDMKNLLPARKPLLPGYPAWYRKLCTKPGDENWSPGPTNIGTAMQITPKLLNLSWEGYPLHYVKGHGWGFLVPNKMERSDGETGDIPLEELVAKCPVLDICGEASKTESDEAFSKLWKDVEVNISKKDYYSKAKKDKTHGAYKGTGVWCNMDLEDCCWFLKLPHKDGPSHKVGNPLAKDFINKFSENVLTGNGDSAVRVIEIARMLSYWRNNRDRIKSQLVVWLDRKDLPAHLVQHHSDFGAIIPQIVVCGTLTRRAMEPTWMTASNAQQERVGSELRGMVQAPPGYKIVGADVDSQELWIASVLGDAHAAGIHGATPLGWMTLSGTKSAGTDMHSVTAKAVGISRDHAKVLNYARIYGAGQNFAQRLLKQFNPTISEGEAKSKAMRMFALTKGKKLYYLKSDHQDEYAVKGYSGYEALKMASVHNKAVHEMFNKAKWEGGTESAMFNRLEEIAGQNFPVTPFLGGRLSRALEPEPGTEDRFLPTRINWVVQSGAVDFLHLMLVCMRWLMGDKIRFSLSFHDEVRYLVKDEYVYKAALAMHITNLLTRSFCASR